jgi:hypothetical protein
MLILSSLNETSLHDLNHLLGFELAWAGVVRRVHDLSSKAELSGLVRPDGAPRLDAKGTTGRNKRAQAIAISRHSKTTPRSNYLAACAYASQRGASIHEGDMSWQG